jgi:hypothetical protein
MTPAKVLQSGQNLGLLPWPGSVSARSRLGGVALTFEGKPLFPERIAEAVPYELTELEQDLLQPGDDLPARVPSLRLRRKSFQAGRRTPIAGHHMRLHTL